MGNEPFIFGDKNLDLSGIKTLDTTSPYVADKLYDLKTQYWNEALTYLGISNVNTVKKERMITDEVQRNLGGTIASRYSRLFMRQQACEQINKMFGLNISVDYREDMQVLDTYDANEANLSNEIDIGKGGEIMSKYTTEVRFICENSAGLSVSEGADNVDSVLDKCWNKVFNFDFPIFDENYRQVLCRKILKHYYTREIAHETVGRWKLALNAKLNEIMPYYNQLYKSELLEFNPFMMLI